MTMETAVAASKYSPFLETARYSMPQLELPTFSVTVTAPNPQHFDIHAKQASIQSLYNSWNASYSCDVTFKLKISWLLHNDGRVTAFSFHHWSYSQLTRSFSVDN